MKKGRVGGAPCGAGVAACSPGRCDGLRVPCPAKAHALHACLGNRGRWHRPLGEGILHHLSPRRPGFKEHGATGPTHPTPP